MLEYFLENVNDIYIYEKNIYLKLIFIGFVVIN